MHGVDIDEAGLAETASQVQAAGGKMSASRHDLTRRDACFAAVDAAHASLGRLDVLGNIAGISRFHLFEQLPEADWNLMLAVNLSAVLWTSQAALPHLVETQGRDRERRVGRGADRPGLHRRVLRHQGRRRAADARAGHGVRRARRARERRRAGRRRHADEREACTSRRRWTGSSSSRTSGKRGMAQPEEIAAAIAYLASDEARFVHGAILSIDGGVAAG